MPAGDRINPLVARITGALLALAGIAAALALTSWEFDAAKLYSPRASFAFFLFIASLCGLAIYIGARLAFAPRRSRPRLPRWMYAVGTGLFLLVLVVAVWSLIAGFSYGGEFGHITLAIAGTIAAFAAWRRPRNRRIAADTKHSDAQLG